MERIERIKDKLALLRSMDAPKNWRGFSYFLNTPLSENKVAEIESELGVTLTDDMRLFVQQVGDGGQLGHLSIDSLVFGYQRHASPPRPPWLFAFPLRMAEPSSHFKAVSWDDLPQEEKETVDVALLIGGAHGDYIYSIVLTGPHREEIWMYSQDDGTIYSPSGAAYEHDGSISPWSSDDPNIEQQSFLHWHEFYLDEALKKFGF